MHRSKDVSRAAGFRLPEIGRGQFVAALLPAWPLAPMSVRLKTVADQRDRVRIRGACWIRALAQSRRSQLVRMK